MTYTHYIKKGSSKSTIFVPINPTAMKNLLLHKYRFYTLTFTGLLVWMLFFDVNDVWTQIKMYRELGRLEDERKYYVQKIKEVEIERIEVMGNKKLVEKFAREKYLMKKPQEEIFVIVDEDNQPLEK